MLTWPYALNHVIVELIVGIIWYYRLELIEWFLKFLLHFVHKLQPRFSSDLTKVDMFYLDTYFWAQNGSISSYGKWFLCYSKDYYDGSLVGIAKKSMRNTKSTFSTSGTLM